MDIFLLFRGCVRALALESSLLTPHVVFVFVEQVVRC